MSIVDMIVTDAIFRNLCKQPLRRRAVPGVKSVHNQRGIIVIHLLDHLPGHIQGLGTGEETDVFEGGLYTHGSPDVQQITVAIDQLTDFARFARRCGNHVGRADPRRQLHSPPGFVQCQFVFTPDSFAPLP